MQRHFWLLEKNQILFRNCLLDPFLKMRFWQVFFRIVIEGAHLDVMSNDSIRYEIHLQI